MPVPPSSWLRSLAQVHLRVNLTRKNTKTFTAVFSPIDAPSEGHGNALYSNHSTADTSKRLSVPGQRPHRDPRRASGAPLGSLTANNQPAALDSVLSALTSAGRKRQAARIMRGTTAEEESRRRRNEKKISEVSSQLRKPMTSYIDRSDPRAFQSINAVLRKVEAEWPFVANDHFQLGRSGTVHVG